MFFLDVNFDGQKDFLVVQGHFGSQGMVKYTCFLASGGTYELNESFSHIANPSLDVQNQKVLSTWRNWAASHSWAMYSFIKGKFTETDRLTQEPEVTEEIREDGSEAELEVWRHEIEHFNLKNTETEVYLTSDYSVDEWIEMFYDENSFWGLFSDKWWTLNNKGALLDWSIYGSGVDVQIMDIIS